MYYILCAKNKEFIKMNTKIRLGTVKYLLAAATLLPVANAAKAETKYVLQRNTSAPTCDPLDLSLRAGFVYSVPTPRATSPYGKDEKIGFNGGAYVEFGGAYWGKLGYSQVEFHVEPVGRIECLSYNTCAYGINADYAAANAVGKTCLPKPVEYYPYERVEDIISTANLNIGLGINGFTFEVVGGMGFHVDTKHQTDAVMCLGAGVGGRINNHIKIRAGYRARVNFFGNGTLKTSNAGMFHHGVEVGFVYMFFKRNNFGYRSYAQNNHHYKHR